MADKTRSFNRRRLEKARRKTGIFKKCPSFGSCWTVLKAAIALGDLSENSEYDDAKNEQAFIEGEILTLEKQIRKQ